jgi:superfamily I DNA/RNA helicase
LFADRLGYNKNFSIYSETERATVIKKSFNECGFEDEKLLKNVKFHIANAKMLGLSPKQYKEEFAGENGINDICRV